MVAIALRRVLFRETTKASASASMSTSYPQSALVETLSRLPLASQRAPPLRWRNRFLSSSSPLSRSQDDPYKLLGLDYSKVGSNGWDVNLDELKVLWRRRVALTHPDRMGGKSEKERMAAEQQSAMINKAYETLREPLQRAHLLLEKHNVPVPSESDSLEDAEVLMQVMELREALEEATSEQEAQQVLEDNQVYFDEAIAQIKKAFTSDPPNVQDASKASVSLRYWTNIQKAAREWQPGKRVELEH